MTSDLAQVLRPLDNNGRNEVNGVSPSHPPSTLTKRPSLKRIKTGPKPKPLSERTYRTFKTVKRVERSYSQGKKMEVLMFLYNHWIEKDRTEKGFRCPTYMDAETFFESPSSTISDWNQPDKVEMLISQGLGGCGGSHTMVQQLWSELEEGLFAMFLERQGEGKVVR
jgi:hypothetical protein